MKILKYVIHFGMTCVACVYILDISVVHCGMFTVV